MTSLNIQDNDISIGGALAVAEALRVNSSLVSLSLESNDIGNYGALAIAEALRFNPTLSHLIVHERLKIPFDDLSNLAVNTQHKLKYLLTILVAEDGAQVLSNKFRMKFPVVTVETKEYCKKILSF